MAKKLGTVNEDSGGATFTVAPKDAAGDPVTPTTAEYAIHDKLSGDVVRAKTSMTPAQEMTITLQPADTAITNAANYLEDKVVTVYIDEGLATARNEEFLYTVVNLRHVPAS